MKQILLRSTALLFTLSVIFTACKKEPSVNNTNKAGEETTLRAEARQAITDKTNTANTAEAEIKQLLNGSNSTLRTHNRNIVQIASSLPVFKSLVAAVIKPALQVYCLLLSSTPPCLLLLMVLLPNYLPRLTMPPISTALRMQARLQL